MRSTVWALGVAMGCTLACGSQPPAGNGTSSTTALSLEARLARAEGALTEKTRDIEVLSARIAAAEAELLASRPPCTGELPALADAIAHEPPDPAWSNAAELDLRRALQAMPWTAGTGLVRVHCGAKRCLAELAHDSLAARAHFEEAALHPPSTKGASAPVTRAESDRKHVRTYYFWDRLGGPSPQTGSEALDPWR